MAVSAAAPISTNVNDAIQRSAVVKEQSKPQTGKSNLGKDDFLKILIAQMGNQDPMQPMQDKEFIAQMAQFSSVEQMTNMATSQASMLSEMKMMRQSLGSMSSMIGKQVYWLDDASQMQHGVVSAVSTKDNQTKVVVNGQNVPIEKVEMIAQSEGLGSK